MIDNKKTNEEKIINTLKDFQQEKEKLDSSLVNNAVRFSIEGEYDKLRLIRYLFDKCLGFTVWDQPFEKMNWEIPFTYKDLQGSLTHQKFGFYIYFIGDIAKEEAQALFDEIAKKIDICLKLVEPIVRQEGIDALNKGEIIVENRLGRIEREFLFFLTEAKRKRRKKKLPKSVSRILDADNPPKLTQARAFRLQTALMGDKRTEYFSDAAYMSFFSLLEHLCILSLAFTQSPERHQFNNFARKTWQEKFKEVFPINDAEFNAYYNKFVNLAKYRRNPAAHGYLDKLNSIFYFYLTEARHRIPMGLYDRELRYETTKEDNLELLGSFMNFIRRNNKTKRIMQYLDRGFDIYYEQNSFKEYEQYMSYTEKSAEEYIEGRLRLMDDMANMDW